MKPKKQLFPKLLDTMSRVITAFEKMPDLEDVDRLTFDFMKQAKQHFNFKDAVSFRLPKNLENVSIMFDGMTNEEIIKKLIPNSKLPFPTISIELEYDFESQTNTNFKIHDLVIVAENRVVDGKDYIDAMFSYGYTHTLSNGKKMHDAVKPIEMIVRFSTDPNLGDDEWVKHIIGQPLDENLECITSCFSTLLFLLAALSCQNVEIEKDFAPSIVENNKLIKKGFSPNKQLHYIVIKQPEKRTGANPNKGSYTKKSTHVRRGHIRRYEHKSIWVEATIINGGVGEVKPKAYLLK